MAGHRVLEIEQPELADAAAAGDQHDVLGMIVAQHGDRAEAVGGDRRQHGAPRGAPGLDVDVEAERRAIPIGEQLQLLEPLRRGRAA